MVVTADPDGKQPGTRFKAALAEAGRAHGLRVLGPGSLGVQAPALGLNASLIPAWPAPGNLALVSQSGSVAVSVVDWAKRHGVGFSHVVSTGDGCDLELGDLLDYLAGDMRTRAVLLHVRSVRDAQFFLSAARALARIKPVIAIRPRDLAAPPAEFVPCVSPDSVYAAAFRRSGVLRVGDIGELFDAVESLGYGKRHSCDKLAVLGNGGGLGLHAAASLLADRTLAVLHPDTLRALTRSLPPRLDIGNPLDLGNDADAERYVQALEALFADPLGPAVLAIHAPSLRVSPAAVAHAVASVAKKSPRPLIACWMSRDDADIRAVFGAASVPVYDSPEKATRAFLHMVKYRVNQRALMELPSERRGGRASTGDPTETPRLSDEAETPEMLGAYGSVVRAIIDDRPLLNEEESLTILRAHGFATLATRVAAGVPAAEAAARELGFPVELRAVAPTVIVDEAAMLRERVDRIEDVPAAIRALETAPALVVQQVPAGMQFVPLSLAIANDPAFGRVIVLSCVGRRSVLLPPLNLALCEDTVSEILQTLRASTGLAVPVRALQDLLVQLSDLVVVLPELVALYVPSLRIVHGSIVLHDARLRVAAQEFGRLHLAIRPYPQHFEEQITLTNGRPVLLRPLRPEDDGAYAEMLAQVTPGDLFLRFCSRFGGDANSIPRDLLAKLVLIDYDRDMSFVAISAGEGGRHEMLGVVDALASSDRSEAEYSIILRSNLKGTGLGKAMMMKIIRYCRSQECARIVGLVRRDNQPMRGLCARLGFSSRTDPEDDMVTVTLPLGPASRPQ